MIDGHTALLIRNQFGSLSTSTAVMIPTVRCKLLWFIANAAAIFYPAALHFNQALMILHLVQCLEQKKFTPVSIA